MTWRDDIRPRVAKVIAQVGTSDMKTLRKALRAAFPYGDVSWQRKVWNDEINAQLGLKDSKQRAQRAARQEEIDAANGQRFLFSAEKDSSP